MRVVIAEDAAVLREGLARLLGDRVHEVCAAVAHADALRAAVAEHGPDAVIADIRMPPGHSDGGRGPRWTSGRTSRRPGCCCSPSTSRPGTLPGCSSRAPGGVGYLLKDRVGHVADFVAALERVAAGGTALDPEVISQLLRRPAAALATLTPREREVLGLMAEGRSNSGVAAKLVLSEGAVGKHIASIFGKLGLEPRRATTAGSWPCCATWACEVSARRRRS